MTKRSPSLANVAATVALVVALSSSAWAAARVTGADVANESLSGRDVRNGSIGPGELSFRALGNEDITIGAAEATAPVSGFPGSSVTLAEVDVTLPKTMDVLLEGTFEMTDVTSDARVTYTLFVDGEELAFVMTDSAAAGLPEISSVSLGQPHLKTIPAGKHRFAIQAEVTGGSITFGTRTIDVVGFSDWGRSR